MPAFSKIETIEDPLRIVALGGGTGLSTVLKGLKRTASATSASAQSPSLDISAVVTVSDDGGSSGRLRRQFDILAPGDIRNCMVALAEDEALLSRLFQYRFSSGKGLEGHSFGNLFLTALTEVTGDFHQAIQLSSEVLAIRGRIYPSTLTNVHLEARLEDGRSMTGESRISRTSDRIRSIRLKPRRCPPLPETLAAISRADLITLGPGSLYTSVIANLLVEGISDAIAASPAVKVYICNLMCQPGETVGYSALDHLKAVFDHSDASLIDYVVVNSRSVSESSRELYAREDAQPVEVDVDALAGLGVEVISEDLLTEDNVVRHDSRRLAELLVQTARLGRSRRSPSSASSKTAIEGGS